MKSERLRIWIVLAAIGGVFFLRFMRAVVVGGRENAVLAFSGGTKQQDDLTAVVIKRT